MALPPVFVPPPPVEAVGDAWLLEARAALGRVGETMGALRAMGAPVDEYACHEPDHPAQPTAAALARHLCAVAGAVALATQAWAGEWRRRAQRLEVLARCATVLAAVCAGGRAHPAERHAIARAALVAAGWRWPFDEVLPPSDGEALVLRLPLSDAPEAEGVCAAAFATGLHDHGGALGSAVRAVVVAGDRRRLAALHMCVWRALGPGAAPDIFAVVVGFALGVPARWAPAVCAAAFVPDDGGALRCVGLGLLRLVAPDQPVRPDGALRVAVPRPAG